MAYAVISYPQIGYSDFNRIQQYRKENDIWLYNVVDPHITFVFPVPGISEDEFINEILDLSNKTNKINFTFRCAIINKDAFSDYYHALLAPDEGFSHIVKLHDKLYSRNLRPYHRMDIDFIPHLGIGNSLDKIKCKEMVDEWNKDDFEITGIISHLTVVKYEDNNIKNLKEIVLL